MLLLWKIPLRTMLSFDIQHFRFISQWNRLLVSLVYRQNWNENTCTQCSYCTFSNSIVFANENWFCIALSNDPLFTPVQGFSLFDNLSLMVFLPITEAVHSAFCSNAQLTLVHSSFRKPFAILCMLQQRLFRYRYTVYYNALVWLWTVQSMQ